MTTKGMFLIISIIAIICTALSFESYLAHMKPKTPQLHKYMVSFTSCELPFKEASGDCGSRKIIVYATNSILAEMHVWNNYYQVSNVYAKELYSENN